MLKPTPQCDIIWSLWEVIESRGWSPHECDYCSYKLDRSEFPCSFCYMKIEQQVSSLQPRTGLPPAPEHAGTLVSDCSPEL